MLDQDIQDIQDILDAIEVELVQIMDINADDSDTALNESGLLGALEGLDAESGISLDVGERKESKGKIVFPITGALTITYKEE